MTNLRFVNEDYPVACLRTVPQFSMVVPLRSQARLWHSLLHWAYFGLFRAQRAAFVRPAYGGPVFRRCALRVLAPPAASRPPTASGRGGNAFFPQTQAFALQKMPEMTYTPSFLIRTFFFRDFVNGLFARPPLDAGQCVFGWISPQKRVIVHSSFKQALNSVIVSSAIVKHTQEGKIIGSEQT